VGEDLF